MGGALSPFIWVRLLACQSVPRTHFILIAQHFIIVIIIIITPIFKIYLRKAAKMAQLVKALALSLNMQMVEGKKTQNMQVTH